MRAQGSFLVGLRSLSNFAFASAAVRRVAAAVFCSASLQDWFQLLLNFEANCRHLACGSGSGVNLLFFACPFPWSGSGVNLLFFACPFPRALLLLQ